MAKGIHISRACAVLFVFRGFVAPLLAQEAGIAEEIAPALAPRTAVVSAAASTSELLSVPVRRLRDYNIPGFDTTLTEYKSVSKMSPVDFITSIIKLYQLKNVVVGQDVLVTKSGTLAISFDDVTIADAMEVVVNVNKLAYEYENGILTIMTDATYALKHGKSFLDQKQIRIVKLKYADATRTAQLLDKVKSAIGTIVADPVTGTLVIIDTTARMKEIERVIQRADIDTIERVIPTRTKTFRIQYAKLEDIQKEVQALISKEAGSVRADKRTRTLIVTDVAYRMKKVEHLISVFDQRTRQVFIEAKIVQVKLSDDFRLGVDWNHLIQGLDPRFSLFSEVKPTGISGLADAKEAAGQLTYRTIVGGGDLNVIVQALKEVGETKIISNPHVAVTDGEEATLKVVTDQPYAQAQLESGTTNVVGEEIQFIEVGAQLSVSPRINDEGMITMKIKPEVSSVVGDYQAFRTVPIIRKSLAETTVMVKDGETIIIAGMIDTIKRSTESRIPILGSIPLLGALFRSESEVVENNELVVFLTPRTISGEEPFLRMKDVKKKPKPLRAVGSPVRKRLKPIR